METHYLSCCRDPLYLFPPLLPSDCRIIWVPLLGSSVSCWNTSYYLIFLGLLLSWPSLPMPFSSPPSFRFWVPISFFGQLCKLLKYWVCCSFLDPLPMPLVFFPFSDCFIYLGFATSPLGSSVSCWNTSMETHYLILLGHLSSRPFTYAPCLPPLFIL